METTYFDVDELKWEDPKISRRDASRRWDRVRQELMNNPNQWAIIVHNNSGKRFNTTLIGKKYLGEGFDIAVRHSGKERNMYARYIGTINKEES